MNNPNILPAQFLGVNFHSARGRTVNKANPIFLSYKVMQILARGLSNLNHQILEDFCREPVASVRLLHYPPHPA